MKPHILIVDDEPSILLTLQANLELEGIDVTTADSGASALEIIKDISFDLVLSDVRMPGMNGVDLFREIRKIHPNVPVILMTAYAMESLINDAIKEGAFTVLPKLFDIEQILPILLAAIQAPMALIIDGESEDAERAATALEDIGLKARAVFDENGAIEAVRDEAVDVCIIELSMAGSGDPTLISRLKLINTSISFVVLSGHDIPELMRKVTESGVVDWIKKPVNQKLILQSLAAARGRYSKK